MANILDFRAFFFTNLEAVESRSRRLKLQSIDGLFESKRFEKVKGSNAVKCAQNKCFSYITDKIVSLRRNQKLWLSCPGFYYCCFYYFLNSIYQHCISSSSFSKWVFSHLYRINIWKFGISMVNIKQVVCEPVKYVTFLI